MWFKRYHIFIIIVYLFFPERQYVDGCVGRNNNRGDGDGGDGDNREEIIDPGGEKNGE